MVFLGNPEYGCDLQPIDFAAFARACGGTGFTIEDPGECGAILDEALATPGPSLVRPSSIRSSRRCPPRSRSSRRCKFAESLVRGEPNREQIALTVFGDRIRELV